MVSPDKVDEKRTTTLKSLLRFISIEIECNMSVRLPRAKTSE
jgi:hypothetical protein